MFHGISLWVFERHCVAFKITWGVYMILENVFCKKTVYIVMFITATTIMLVEKFHLISKISTQIHSYELIYCVRLQ